ncbi:hypothetical protein PDESU_02735 [Pontiella desulfatans]|uniref:Uncharacterized protein n=1 Tax=Pontiella desulfatans TaxID=2750659 RepID=A0A6C2U455_PONDE|nr:DUF4955 domain-containing protein [Pontiella desulfatans]VGO14176.1 hypothetical protein PDESU_02735 [Pontiella desulfatans]
MDTFTNSAELASYNPIDGNNSSIQTLLLGSSSTDGSHLDGASDGYARLHRTKTTTDTIGLTRDLGTITLSDVGRTITIDAAFAVPDSNLESIWEIHVDGSGVGGQGKMVINTFGSGNASGGNAALQLSTISLGTQNPQRSTTGALEYEVQAADVGKIATLRFAHYEGSTAGAEGTRNVLVDAISYAVLPELSTNVPTFAMDPVIGNTATNYIPYIGTLAGSASDSGGGPLTYSKISGANWLRVFPNGTLAGAPDGSHVGLNTFTVLAENGDGGTAVATLEINVVNGGARVAYNDDFESGSGTLGSINGWTGQGGEDKEYNVSASGMLVIQEQDSVESFFDVVYSSMNGAIGLTNPGDWIRLSMDFEVFSGSGAVANDSSGLRISLTDSTASTNAGYGIYVATGTSTSHTYQEMKSAASSQASIGNALAGFDVSEDSGLNHLELLLTRLDSGVELSGTLAGQTLAVLTNNNAAIANRMFDRLALSVGSKNHGLNIDNVVVELPNTSILWNDYVTAYNNGTNSTLKNFSYAGYHYSEIPIPEITTNSHIWFDVTSYGAIANDGNSDRDAVLLALADAHAYTGAAVVYFPEGRFLLKESSDLGKAPIEVTRSDIVIKGAGMGETELLFSEFSRFGDALVSFRSSSGEVSDYWRGDQVLAGKVTEQLGDFSVRVDNPSGLAAGQKINFSWKFPATTPVGDAYFAPHAVPQGVLDRHDGTPNDVFEVHTIASVVGDVVTFNEPIHIESEYFIERGMYRIDNTIEECGIEDLTLRGKWHGQFSHHNGCRQGEEYRMLGFNRVFNSWARRLRIVDFSYALSATMTGANTFSDILLEGNPGHFSISVQRSTGNLFAYVRENTDAHHGLGGQSSAAGTVFLRSNQYGNMEAHCNWFRNTLYDLNEGIFTQFRGGGAVKSPMHDKGLTFWNWSNTEAGSYDFWPLGSNYGYFLFPTIAGLHGEPATFSDVETDILALESNGTKLEPESLFEAQLALRLGGLPQWFADSSAAFEVSSRNADIAMMSPANYAAFADLSPVALVADTALDPAEIAALDFEVSGASRWDGFETLPKADAASLSGAFVPPYDGVWTIRAKLTNVRGEVSFSDPIAVHCGSSMIQQQSVSSATYANGNDKVAQYSDFLSIGGGEASYNTGSAVVASKPANAPWNTIEVAFEAERQGMYSSFGTTNQAAFLGNAGRVAAGAKFFDNNLGTSSTVYHWLDTLVQADFGSTVRIHRLDIHWSGSAPSSGVRLELQTPLDYPACLNSVVNDDKTWESGVWRIGGTLRQEILPSSGGVTTLYFPERPVQAVRLLLSNFEGNIAELKFYGPQDNRPLDHYLSWINGQGLYGQDAGYRADLDGDLRDGLFEYAVGGIPTPGSNSLSEVPMVGNDGPDFEYIHHRRRNAASLGLTYTLETSADLVEGSWVPAVITEESALVDAEFETVTNRISMAGNTNGFVRLKIKMD